LAILPGGQRWPLIAMGSRIVAAATLAMTLAATGWDQGYTRPAYPRPWSPFDPQQAALALALAITGVHLICIWRAKVDGAGPVADLLASSLAAAALWRTFLPPPVSSALAGPWTGCATVDQAIHSQQWVPFYAQWTLWFLGAGAATVAGSAGLMEAGHNLLTASRGRVPSALRDRPTRAHAGQRPSPLCAPPTRPSKYLRRFTGLAATNSAVWLAVIGLGGGLTVAVWWAWQTAGSLSSGDSHEGWLTVAWLLAAMSLTARHLPGGAWGRTRLTSPDVIRAALAVASGATSVMGLFAASGLRAL
jgi:hypothetical protein